MYNRVRRVGAWVHTRAQPLKNNKPFVRGSSLDIKNQFPTNKNADHENFFKFTIFAELISSFFHFFI